MIDSVPKQFRSAGEAATAEAAASVADGATTAIVVVTLFI
jgi:hypothetical protein